MSGSLLPNTTRASASVPYFQPFGTGGGGGGPNPSFSTITVAGAASVGSLACAGQITADAAAVSTINAQTIGNLSSINAPANLAVACANLSINQGGGNTTTLTNGNLSVPQGITGQAFVGTLNFVSAPVLTVSSINGVNFQPPPVRSLVRIAATGGGAGANGATYTLPVNSTIVPLTAVFSTTVGRLYRISCNLYDAANNDTTTTKTVIAVGDAAATAVEFPIWTSNNDLLSSTGARGFCGISTVFVAQTTSYSVIAYNTSTTDTTSIEITLTGTSTNPGFILEDLGVAP